jgi:hypothetical protein
MTVVAADEASHGDERKTSEYSGLTRMKWT